MDYCVNIIQLGNPLTDESLVDLFIERFVAICHSDKWKREGIGFNIQQQEQTIVITGGQSLLHDLRIRFINIPYVKEIYESKTLQESWLRQFNLLVVAGTTTQYKSSCYEMARIRDLMENANRKNDCILFLSELEKIMDIANYGKDDACRAVAVYSALTGQPYDNNTHLQQSPFLSYLNGECVCQCKDNDTDKRFSMPINLLCDLNDSSGHECLCVEIINRVASVDNLRLTIKTPSYLNNYIMDHSIKSICGKKKIRLAVIGKTSSGKTYFLEDFVRALTHQNVLGYSETETQAGFGTITNFNAEIHKEGYVLGKTEVYACRHKNVYCTHLTKGNKTIDLRFIDIPGDIVKVENNNCCYSIYQGLKRQKGKMFYELTWTNDEGNTTYKKTIHYIRQKSSKKISRNNSIFSFNKNKDVLNTIIGNAKTYGENNSYLTQAINGIRTENYASKEDIISYMTEKYNTPKIKRISGQQLIKNISEYDMDSVFNALFDLYGDLGIYDINITVSDKAEYQTIIKSFYFYLFLYEATDVVLCNKFLDQNNNNIEDNGNNWFSSSVATTLNSIKGNNQNIRFYLGIKGIDTLMDKDKLKQFYNNLNNSVDKENQTYSFFALQLYNKIYPDNAIIINTDDYCCTPKEGNPVSANAQNNVNYIIDNIPNDNIKNCIDIFSAIQGRNENSKYNPLPYHVYFLATPIDSNYNVNTFLGDVIDGNSSSAINRCYFGTLQLLEDILIDNSCPIPDNYNNSGKFLQYIRGNATDTN